MCHVPPSSTASRASASSEPCQTLCTRQFRPGRGSNDDKGWVLKGMDCFAGIIVTLPRRNVELHSAQCLRQATGKITVQDAVKRLGTGYNIVVAICQGSVVFAVKPNWHRKQQPCRCDGRIPTMPTSSFTDQRFDITPSLPVIRQFFLHAKNSKILMPNL